MIHVRNSIKGIFILEHDTIPTSNETLFGEPIPIGSLCIDKTNGNVYIKHSTWTQLATSSGDYIPLSGTLIDNNVSGDITFENNVSIQRGVNRIRFTDDALIFEIDDNDVNKSLNLTFKLDRNFILNKDGANITSSSNSRRNIVYSVEDRLTLTNLSYMNSIFGEIYRAVFNNSNHNTVNARMYNANFTDSTYNFITGNYVDTDFIGVDNNFIKGFFDNTVITGTNNNLFFNHQYSTFTGDNNVVLGNVSLTDYEANNNVIIGRCELDVVTSNNTFIDSTNIDCNSTENNVYINVNDITADQSNSVYLPTIKMVNDSIINTLNTVSTQNNIWTFPDITGNVTVGFERIVLELDMTLPSNTTHIIIPQTPNKMFVPTYIGIVCTEAINVYNTYNSIVFSELDNGQQEPYYFSLIQPLIMNTVFSLDYGTHKAVNLNHQNWTVRTTQSTQVSGTSEFGHKWKLIITGVIHEYTI